MKLFLTGPSGAGKTTIVNECAALWQAAGRGGLLGFRTFKEQPPLMPVAGEGSRSAQAAASAATFVCLSAAVSGARTTVARFADGESRLYPEVFDRAGVRLLRGVGQDACGLVLMDEIGYIESEALLFQREVLRVLALPVPVLGVLRDKPTPFLDALRAREDLTVVRVEEGTRQQARAACLAHLGLPGQEAGEELNHRRGYDRMERTNSTRESGA